jgi:hypothetical protein
MSLAVISPLSHTVPLGAIRVRNEDLRVVRRVLCAAPFGYCA